MYRFAFNNLWLKRSRTLLALLGLCVAVTGMIGLISISQGIKTEVTDVVSKMEGINILQKDAMDDMFSTISMDTVREIAELPEVKAAAPYITTMASGVEGKSRDLKAAPMGGMVSVMGIDPAESAKLKEGSIFRPVMKKGRFLTKNDRTSVILGATVADQYNKAVGSQIKFNNMDFRVVGIFETGSMITDSLIYVPIDAVREMTGKEDDVANAAYIELRDPKKAEEMADILEFRFDDIEARTATGFTEEFGGLLSQLDMFFLMISSVALLVGAIGIINTMLMSVIERYREFGILRAIGWTRDNLVRLVFFESLFIGIIGSAAGCVLGFFAALGLRAAIPIRVTATPELLVTAFAIGVLLSVVGAAYPAYKASRLDPIEAIRYG